MAKEVFAEQLPLGIGLRDDCTLDTFYPGSNEQALTHIKQMAQGSSTEPFIYLWGRAGVGRTHLLQGACHWANSFHLSAFYLSLPSALKNLKVLDGLERIQLICMDDVDVIAGNAQWEEALFHCFNRLRANNRHLIIAGHSSPKGLGIQLPDLQSRLTWGVTYQLHPLDEDELICALQLRAKQRGLELPTEVGHYIIRRLPRSMPQLHASLDTLDAASLAQQRRLTIPFVKSVLFPEV